MSYGHQTYILITSVVGGDVHGILLDLQVTMAMDHLIDGRFEKT